MTLDAEKVVHLSNFFAPGDDRNIAKSAAKTSANHLEIEEALSFISPDVPRGDGTIFSERQVVEGYWLGVIFALRREGGDAVKRIARDWSIESPRFTEDGFEKSWAEFDEFHEKPITIASVYRLAERNGWKKRSKVSGYDLLDRDAIMSIEPVKWMVRSVFPTTGIAAIFGPSGSGKSFQALDLGMRVASGEEWFGRRTEMRPVTYVMLEGEAGLRNRVVAWEKVHRREIPEAFTSITQPFDFTEPDDVEALASALPKQSVTIVDTLNRAAPGKDENSSKDMGEVIAGMKRLQELTGGLVLSVHHTGKDASRGLRGHSSLHAALDGAIEVKREKDARSWSTAKVKDGDDSAQTAFTFRSVELGFYPDGDSMNSLVVMPDTAALLRVPEPRGKNQNLVWHALKADGRQEFSFEEAVDVGSAALDIQPRRRKTVTRDVIRDLLKRGNLTGDENIVRIKDHN